MTVQSISCSECTKSAEDAGDRGRQGVDGKSLELPLNFAVKLTLPIENVYFPPMASL